MKSKSGHITFKRGTKYKDLLPAYKDLYLTFLEETDQMPEEPELEPTTPTVFETAAPSVMTSEPVPELPTYR